MIRWPRTDPDRLLPQEMALLALCDRMTTLEQAFTAEAETHRKITLEQARRLAVQHDQLIAAREAILKLESRLARLEREHRSLLAILEREA